MTLAGVLDATEHHASTGCDVEDRHKGEGGASAVLAR